MAHFKVSACSQNGFPYTRSGCAYLHLLCRFIDPIFAVCVGTTAAAIRIRREQIAKYPDQENDWGNLWKKAQRMGKGYLTEYREME
jgi:Non-classical export protein 1